MSIEFADENILELYSLGFCSCYAGISNKVLDDFITVLSMAASASCMNDILNPPPFKGQLKDDGSCLIPLCEGWILNFLLKISDEGNDITVISLCQV